LALIRNSRVIVCLFAFLGRATAPAGAQTLPFCNFPGMSTGFAGAGNSPLYSATWLLKKGALFFTVGG
jgi:hypothetical protein